MKVEGVKPEIDTGGVVHENLNELLIAGAGAADGDLLG